MGCTRPMRVWPPAPGASNRRPVFSPFRSFQGARGSLLPCGQCVGCRLKIRGDWATRMVHEASLHPPGTCWFITLTYAPEFIPWDGSISKGEIQRFHKRLRYFAGSYRHFSCGEYGDKGDRPHYHFIGFGLDLGDLGDPAGQSDKGEAYWQSEAVTAAWPKGFISIQPFTPNTASYVAGYTQKKLNGQMEMDRYRRSGTCPFSGQPREWNVIPEFALMSRRPGIGSGWQDKYDRDVFPRDFVTRDGRKLPVPRFYDRRRTELEKLKLLQKRKAAARLHADNNTERRLATRDELNILRTKRLIRGFERSP